MGRTARRPKKKIKAKRLLKTHKKVFFPDNKAKLRPKRWNLGEPFKALMHQMNPFALQMKRTTLKTDPKKIILRSGTNSKRMLNSEWKSIEYEHINKKMFIDHIRDRGSRKLRKDVYENRNKIVEDLADFLFHDIKNMTTQEDIDIRNIHLKRNKKGELRINKITDFERTTTMEDFHAPKDKYDTIYRGKGFVTEFRKSERFINDIVLDFAPKNLSEKQKEREVKRLFEKLKKKVLEKANKEL